LSEPERFLALPFLSNLQLADILSVENIPLFVGLFILLVFSSFFSMSETVFSSVSKIRLKTYIEDGHKKAKRAFYITDDFDRALTSILIGNNLANIALATISVSLFSKIFASFENMDTLVTVFNTFVMTTIILIFGEIVPKSFAKRYADSLSLRIAPILQFFIILFTPLAWFFLSIKSWIIKGDHKEGLSVTGNELETIIDTMEEEGSIDEDEADMLQSVLDIHSKTVYEIMTPRVDIVMIDIEDTIEEVKQTFFENQFSRIPVFKEDRDHVVGVLHERDFLTALIREEDIKLEDMMSEPFYVSKSMKVDTLIETLQRENVHLAIVSGEYGGTSGLVTMEDALEELVGEIYDEHDDLEDEEITTLKENKYGIDANIDLDELFEELNLGRLPETSYSTLGGWLYECFEDIPEVDDTHTYESERTIYTDDGPIDETLILKFIVKDIKERRIQYVHLYVDILKSESTDA
jgi:putative hemolysin